MEARLTIGRPRKVPWRCSRVDDWAAERGEEVSSTRCPDPSGSMRGRSYGLLKKARHAPIDLLPPNHIMLFYHSDVDMSSEEKGGRDAPL